MLRAGDAGRTEVKGDGEGLRMVGGALLETDEWRGMGGAAG